MTRHEEIPAGQITWDIARRSSRLSTSIDPLETSDSFHVVIQVMLHKDTPTGEALT